MIYFYTYLWNDPGGLYDFLKLELHPEDQILTYVQDNNSTQIPLINLSFFKYL
jgi:hypothetical protein